MINAVDNMRNFRKTRGYIYFIRVTFQPRISESFIAFVMLFATNLLGWGQGYGSPYASYVRMRLIQTLFADDSSLFYSAAHIDDIAGIINHDMQLLLNLARQWLVTFNPLKIEAV